MATAKPLVVVDARLGTPVSPARGSLIGAKGTATPAQIKLVKQHVIRMATRIAKLKTEMKVSQAALAALDPTTVNAVVVPGYPPPT
jgi:hypothetical protein